MLELWDYLVQFLVTAYGFCAALREYYRARRRPWFLLTCFYATFALGTLYWTLHLLLRQETPQVFYVSDLAWLASFATFENVCYLTQNGAGQFVYLLIRGFGTGAMHIVCGSVYGRVLRPVWLTARKFWRKSCRKIAGKKAKNRAQKLPESRIFWRLDFSRAPRFGRSICS